jgi:uncharacterized phage protein gp47/JayE
MAYFAPYIDAAGLHICSYIDILNYYIAQYQNIYGQSVYLANDSSDYQDLCIRALMTNDVFQSLQLEYNQRSPGTVIGAAQDSLYKLNGLLRKSASYSIVPTDGATYGILISGTPGTVINNGQISDGNGNIWILPTPIIIGAGGTIYVGATCSVLGSITALIGNITSITTPIAGWTSVNNTVAATPGIPAETGSQFRARQAISTELPSQTLLAGTIAAIAALSGVTRWNVQENDTAITNALGLTPHSIWVVVEGGINASIAQTIALNKAGCGTNGTTMIPITDPISNITEDIYFSRPAYINVFAVLNVHLLAGGTSATLAAIQAAIVTYLNSLQIGELVTHSAIYGAALSVMPDLAVPLFSIRSILIGCDSGVLTYSIDTVGSGYTTVNALPTVGGSGTGLTVNITASGGNLSTVTIVSSGSGYKVGDIVAILQGTNITGTILITALQNGTQQSTTDIPVNFNAVANGVTANIIVNSVA